MKKLSLPSSHTILLLLLLVTVLLTWLIPAGKYSTLSYSEDSKKFTQTTNDVKVELPASQKTLDSLKIKLELEKFTSGEIWKPINIPNTFTFTKSNSQGFTEMLLAPVKGIIEASDIIFFVLILGGIVGIINYTGAFDAGISRLATVLKGHEYWLVIIVMSLVALGGTTFGFAEETIAFYPVLIPVFLAAGYDAMVGLAAIYLGSCIGTMCSTVNPFATIIASNVAGVNWTTGIELRTVALIGGLLICIIYTLRYANKVKKDPSASIIFSQKQEIEKHLLHTTSDKTIAPFDFRIKSILIVFLLCFVLMIIGVSKLKWWFTEMSALFLFGAIVIGFIARINEKKFWSLYITGAGELLGVAIIIGIARGISVVMNDGLISDTVLYYASQATEGVHKGLFVNLIMFIYSGLSFFVPSSSGMAVLTMPIFAPLADSVGVGREVIVTAYQFGTGLFAFINPTGLILASLTVINIGYNKWLKFVMPLILILTLGVILTLTISIL